MFRGEKIMKKLNFFKVLEVICLIIAVMYMVFAIKNHEHPPYYMGVVFSVILANYFKGTKDE